jgi:MFS family permease
MSTSVPESPSLIHHRPFVLFWMARLASTMGYQMLAVTIGWQVYELTDSAFDLGLVGLIQFVPAVVLTLLIGHAADRYDRRLIVRTAHGVYALAAIMITAALLAGVLTRDLLFGAVFLIACARAFELPTAHSLVPALVPGPMIARAVAAWTSANQVAVICGPALGGLLYTISPKLVGTLCLVFFTASITLITLVHSKGPAANREPPTFASVLAGFEFIRTRRRLLGVITLDLFVVLLGGATALMPIYARDILAVGPIGLGLLRSAPAAGALITAIVLSRHPVERLRRDNHRVRAVDLVSVVIAGAGGARRLRCGERRHPLLAGADRDAR